MIRTFAPISLALLMISLFLCDDIKAATDNSESGIDAATRETVEQLVRQFNDAILSQDQAVLNGFLSTDYTFGGSPTLTKQEYIGQIVATIAPKEQSIDSMSVKLYGDTAVVTGLTTANWISPAGLATKSFSWVNVWYLGENGWQVVYSHSTILQPDMGC